MQKKEAEQAYKPYQEPVELGSISDHEHIIHCVQCQTAIHSNNININDLVAKCTNCHSVFSIRDEIQFESTLNSHQDKPVGVDVYKDKHTLELVVDQPHSSLHTVLASLSPLLTFMFFGLFAKHGNQIFMYLAIGSVLVMINSILKLILHKREKIYVHVDSSFLKVEYRPKNLIRDRAIPVQDINQIYVKSIGHLYELIAIVQTEQGIEHRAILSKFSKLLHVKYIEQIIEQQLSIRNKAIPRETK